MQCKGRWEGRWCNKSKCLHHHKQRNRQRLYLCRFNAKFFYPMYFAGFHHARQSQAFLEILCHFRSFGSATCLIADALQGVHDIVGHFRLSTMRFNSSLSDSAISVATFDQFILLWCQCYDLIRREQANSKVWSIRPRSFHCHNGME